MADVTVSRYVQGPEVGSVTVFDRAGNRATAEHPERDDATSIHYYPRLNGDALYIVRPSLLGRRAAERFVRHEAARRCAGRAWTEYYSKALRTWVRITPGTLERIR